MYVSCSVLLIKERLTINFNMFLLFYKILNFKWYIQHIDYYKINISFYNDVQNHQVVVWVILAHIESLIWRDTKFCWRIWHSWLFSSFQKHQKNQIIPAILSKSGSSKTSEKSNNTNHPIEEWLIEDIRKIK